MSSKYKLKLSKRLYRQLLAADVAVVRPQLSTVDCSILMHPAIHYRRYVSENQQAIGYVAYQGWQSQGRGFVALTPLWEQEHPELALLYVSIANLWRLPLLEMASSNNMPRWYLSLAQSVRSQLMTRLDTYEPQTEVVILGQVEDITQMYPDDQIYEQIQRVEIFTYCEFEPSLPDCYEQFKGRASEFIVYE